MKKIIIDIIWVMMLDNKLDDNLWPKVILKMIYMKKIWLSNEITFI